MPLEWIMATAVNAIVGAHRFRSAAGSPDVEYALDLEVSATFGEPYLAGFWYKSPSDVVGPLSPNPLMLWRLSIGSPSEFQQVFNVILTDIYDAASVHRTETDPELIVDLGDALGEGL